MAVLRALGDRIGAFSRLPVFIQAWSVPVWCLLGASRLLVLTIPFRRLSAVLGKGEGAMPWIPLLSDAQTLRALQIGRVVRTMARFTPWDSNCFAQAITARLLLGLYGLPYALFFGLMRDAGSAGLNAHAWIAAGRIRVTGGVSFGQYTVVAMYVSPTLGRYAKPLTPA